MKNASWANNPIDRFVLAEQEQRGWEPSSEADRPVLLRRLSLAITGLPPTIAEVDDFMGDTRPDAVDQQVDRLLASPRFGEHFARSWLDLARYGDTHGLHIDNYRSIYPYRDWVIRAFQENKPYDRFLTEQVAGDLLPDATPDQQIATGFLRCNISTNECGTIEAEADARNLFDRVDTFGQAMLGLTVGCAKCHDHKYDPISQREYYALAAFFNSIDGTPKDGNQASPPPFVRLGDPASLDQLSKLEEELAQCRAEIRRVALQQPPPPAASGDGRLAFGDFVWFDHELPEGARPVDEGPREKTWKWIIPPSPLQPGRTAVEVEAEGPVRLALHRAKPGLKIGAGDRLFVQVWIDPNHEPAALTLRWHTDSWRHAAAWSSADVAADVSARGPLPPAGRWTRLEVPVEDVGLRDGDVVNGWSIEQEGGRTFWNDFGLTTRTPQNESQTYDTQIEWERALTEIGLVNTHLPGDIQEIIKVAPGLRSHDQRRTLDEFFRAYGYRANTVVLAPLRAKLAELRREWDTLDGRTSTSLVFGERPEPRRTFILIRGNYDHPGEEVDRGVPEVLSPFPAGQPRNRLGLAAWMTDRNNPLVARVAVNRIWQQLLGTGLVRTAEDFGIRGEPPSHPALLDWLAVSFIADDWNVKQTVRRIVLSRTFRQTAINRSEHPLIDPDNRWLSRGPRFRLDAETLRDQALIAGGLLVEQIGGPSVKPPQPPGLWEAVAIPGSNTGVFVADRGADKIYRRGLYTFWKRSAPPPQLAILDAPTREICVVRRERNATPLQSLVMMNDISFVGAASGLAEQAVTLAANDDSRLVHLFRLVLCRFPSEQEMNTLRRVLEDHRERFLLFPGEAAALARLGDASSSFTPSQQIERATWTMVGTLLLNLDETVTP